MKKTTIKDVAQAAGVSISTVSLVMNGKGNVGNETREKVTQTASRLGYVPLQAARRLVTRRTGNVGFVVQEDRFTRSEPFYTHVFLGTEFEANHHAVYVLLTTIRPDYERSTSTPRFLKERNVDGIIVAGRVNAKFMLDAAASGVPVVTVDFESPEVPSVVIDNQLGGRTAVAHLLERGHRRIAFLGADDAHPSIRARREGYRLALVEAGIAADPALELAIQDSEPKRRAGVVLAKRLMNVKPRPTAVFCANDAIALGVLDYMKSKCLAVPDELAIVGFDDANGAATSVPGLTTIRVFKEQLGELALKYLIELIDQKTSQPETHGRNPHALMVGTELIVRETT